MNVGEFITQNLPSILAAVAVYVGIRIDLARLHERIEAHAREISDAKASAQRAHERIDRGRN